MYKFIFKYIYKYDSMHIYIYIYKANILYCIVQFSFPQFLHIDIISYNLMLT